MRKTVLCPWRSLRLNLKGGRARTRVLEEGRVQGRGVRARGMRLYGSISTNDAIKIEENTCPRRSDPPLHSLSYWFLGHNRELWV